MTAPLLKELIGRIDVSEVQGKGKNRIQPITIHYRFVGYLEMEQEYKSSSSDCERCTYLSRKYTLCCCVSGE